MVLHRHTPNNDSLIVLVDLLFSPSHLHHLKKKERKKEKKKDKKFTKIKFKKSIKYLSVSNCFIPFLKSAKFSEFSPKSKKNFFQLVSSITFLLFDLLIDSFLLLHEQLLKSSKY